MRVRRAGRSVAVIDEKPFGGTCALRGCDPKKMLVAGAEVIDAERRMRGSIGAMTAGMGAMMEQVAVLAPAMRRSLEAMARSMEDAMRPVDRAWDE